MRNLVAPLSCNKHNNYHPNHLNKTYIRKNLTINLSGDEIRTDKHHRCKGNYYGYGLISKYKTRNKLSVFEFKGNGKDDEDLKSIISVLKYDIE